MSNANEKAVSEAGQQQREVMPLPDWKTVARKRQDGKPLTTLEAFIYKYEPADGLPWRKALHKVLKEAT